MSSKAKRLGISSILPVMIIGSAAMAAGSHNGAGHQMMHPEAGEPGDPAAATETVEIVMNDNYFEPESISVPAGATVRFVVKNEGGLLHEFNIGTAAMHAKMQPEMEMMMEHGMISETSGHHDMENMDHSEMDHSAMGHGPANENGEIDPHPVGWDEAGTPPGAKQLTYADLKALKPSGDQREPSQEIAVNLTGIMERYIWTLNGQKFGDEEVIRVIEGDRIRLRFVNDTMMAHPMHLHGMFMGLENGETDRKPRKHVIIVPPGQTVTAVLTADEVGEWPFHCHLLYHMASGMMTRFIVEPKGTQLSNLEEG